MSFLPAQVPSQEPSPVLFFETINAYQRTAALRAAVELGVFTAIASGSRSAERLAKECQASERGLRILCDFLTVVGFLKKEQKTYRLTPDTAMFLDRRSPAYVGGSITFLSSPVLTDGFKDVAAVVRKGGTLISQEGTLAPEHPVWVEFARAMAPLMALPAELIAKLVGATSAAAPKWKVLDIAAGHGLFGITLAKYNPKTEVVAVDWSNVLQVAKENAHKAGIAERYQVIAGSAFDVEYGNGYDLVLLANFLHHFDQGTCEKLLRKIHAAMKPGGRAITFEFVPNEDRVSPPVAATFAMMMLGTTPHGDAYTFSEYQRMFRNAGFSRSELNPLPPTFEQVVISHK